MANKTAVVVGATGIIGRAIRQTLANDDKWNVIAISRSGTAILGADRTLSVDLSDSKSARQQLSEIKEATHLFYAAYQPKPTFAEEVEPNRALLINAVEGLEATGSPLEHVTLITGAKYYGVHLGPAPSPLREDDSRPLGPNFNFVQEDYLRSRAHVKWHWTNLIPTHLTGYATGNPMNLALAIGVYASIVKELKIPFYFPGSQKAFEAMTQIVDALQISQAALWAATSNAANGQAFNISNGDPTRWCQLWPEIAKYFGLEVGGARPISFASVMSDYADLWGKVAEKYNLKYSDLNSLVNWKFLEFIFAIEFDIVLALGKIRRAGFTQHPDTMDCFRKRFDEYKANRIIPV